MTGAVDTLLREIVRETLAEGADAFRRDIKCLLAEELGRLGDSARSSNTEYVSVKTAAKLGGVHESTIRGWIKAGKLKAYQPEPRILRTRIDELHALMAGSNGSAGVVDLDARVRVLTARIVPCPAEPVYAEGNPRATCVQCRLCLDRDPVALNTAIAFEVHGPRSKKARRALARLLRRNQEQADSGNNSLGTHTSRSAGGGALAEAYP